MNQPKAVFRGMIFLCFVIGLEILIMTSPAAGFFYAVFNPFLLSLAQNPATRWLTVFFLPHRVSPPNLLLIIVRVAGSVLFVADVEVHDLVLQDVRDLPSERGWGRVPAPIF